VVDYLLIIDGDWITFTIWFHFDWFTIVTDPFFLDEVKEMGVLSLPNKGFLGTSHSLSNNNFYQEQAQIISKLKVERIFFNVNVNVNYTCSS
jgi:hypothetical protein